MQQENVGGQPESAVLNVPFEFIQELATMAEETLRVVLALLISEERAKMPGATRGVSQEVVELAENAGLSIGRVHYCLPGLVKKGWVAKDAKGAYLIGPLLPGRIVTRGH